MTTVAVDDLIERQPVGRFLMLTLALGTAVQVLDGYDLISIADVGPLIAAALHIEKTQLGPIFGASFIGAMLGAFFFGLLGDWFGRKPVTILCVLIFGAFSLMTVWANSMGVLIALRFLTGLGVGGVMPTCVALLSEYAPGRVRGTVVTVMACGLSIGAAGAGLVAAKLVPLYGWPSMFYVGGILPLILAPFLYIWLPESARFLVLKKRPAPRIAAILARVTASFRFEPGITFTVHEAALTGLPVRHLFAKGWAVATMLLWSTIFWNLLCITFYSQWMPTLFNAFGLDMTAAVTAAAVFQIGGVVGAVLLGRLIDRFGWFSVMGGAYVTAAIFAVLLVSFGPSAVKIVTCAFFSGVGLAGAQNAANALSGALYPTMVRSTGSGWGIGVGRIGGSIGPFAGALFLGLHWSVPAIFIASAVPCFLAALSVLLLGWQAGRSPEICSARQVELSRTAPALGGV